MEMDSVWLMILSALLGGYVFVFGLFRKLNEWYYVAWHGIFGNTKYPLPPGDMGWPLIGNLFTFLRAFESGDPDSFVNNLVSRYGQAAMYKTHLFGNPSVIVYAAETCKEVMMDDEHFNLGYPKVMYILMGQRSFHNISSDEHRLLRRLITPPFKGHQALSVYVEWIERIVVNNLDEWSSSDRPIELVTELKKVMLKVIANICLGFDSDAFFQEIWELYADISVGMASLVINIPGFAFHRALQARKKLVKIIQTFLDEKRERIIIGTNENKKDMIDVLMAEKDEEGNQHLDDEHIVNLLLTFMFGGHETSAYAAMWAVIYLTQHPQILAQAKEEQEEILKRRPSTQKGLTLWEIKQMPYLSKVIDETLRRTTLTFALFRQSKVDVHVNGYTIPKGWKVLTWNREVHMDPQTYPNPKEFDPQRWENNKPKPGYFLPFGIGSRLCPGADLAKLEISIFLHHFLLYYKVERLNPTAPLNFMPLPVPLDKCLARVIKVNP